MVHCIQNLWHDKITKYTLFLSFTILLMASCNQKSSEIKEEPAIENILLQPWTGPYGGVPAFDQMKVEDVKAAVIQGMELT